MKSYRVIRRISTRQWMEVSGELHTPAAFCVVPQNRSGRFGSEKILLRSPLFWDIMQRRMVACCRYFRATCWYRNVGNKLRCVRSEKIEDVTPREKPEITQKSCLPLLEFESHDRPSRSIVAIPTMPLGLQTLLYSFRKKMK